MEIDRRAELAAIARSSRWFMEALRAVRVLRLESWCIGAGAVRNLVWDHLHGYASPSALSDVDVAYFDAEDIRPQTDAALQARLGELMPSLPWEVTNQAGVHLWFESHFGHPVPPLYSLADAIGTWPEFATSVGITLTDEDEISVLAPHGLADLFTMCVRRNPVRVSVETYRQRVAQKQYQERWPRVTVVPC
jgi:hypothetical protein